MKILVFSPGHAIWSWTFPVGLTAESLKQRGHEILYLYCDREYETGCMAQASKGVQWVSTPEAKAEICRQCTENAHLITTRLDLATASINSFLTHEDRIEAKKIVEGATSKNFNQIELIGLPVGRLAMYEFVIQNMKRSVSFEGREWEHYCNILENVCKAALGFARACETFHPDACLIEHTAYSYNRACQMVAEKKGISSYYMNASTANVAHGFELLVVAKGDPLTFYRNTIDAWTKSKDIPVSADEAKAVTDHFIALITAKGKVYSTAKSNGASSIRKKFGIRPDQKVLLATTSSYDEMFAVEVVGNFAWNTKSDVFELQIDWIKTLLDFMRKRPELFLIIRVHPREFMATKNGGLSEHAQQLRNELKTLPSNVAVNWPSDKISLYDLIEEIDVGLNAWSTAGSELNFFGIPVVVYCGHLLLYPESLNYAAKTREEYFQFIDKALKEGWKFERVQILYRWYATHQLRVAANISDSFPDNTLRKRGFLERAYFKFRRIFNHQFDYIYLINKRARTLGASAQIEQLLKIDGNTFLDLSEDGRGTSGVLSSCSCSCSCSSSTETDIIREQLKRLYCVMYGENEPSSKQGLLQSRLRAAIF